MTDESDKRLRNVLWPALGLFAGISLGLFLGWVAWPAQFSEADPTVLQTTYKTDYALMVAAAYSLDGDLAAARIRLGSLGLENTNDWLLTLTLDYILGGGDERQVRQLVLLANDMGLRSPAMTPFLPESGEDS